jgi:peptidoglycan/xylan/chitin deacetylase (PgdA/CDA1 family)
VTSSASEQTTSPQQSVTNQKEAYLTFDDGPSANTGQILDTLKAYGVKATFFVNGTENEDEKALYKRIAAERHAIGLHGYSHDYAAVYRSVNAFRADMARLTQLLEQTVGYKPNILRFPGGSNNTVSRKSGGEDIMDKLIKFVGEEGFTYFDWNVDSKDADEAVQEKGTIVRSVLKESENQEKIIVLLHDSNKKRTTVDALPELIKSLQNRGYVFKTLSKQSFNYKLK